MLIQNGSNVFSEINGRYPLHLIFRSVDDGNFERVQSKDPVHTVRQINLNTLLVKYYNGYVDKQSCGRVGIEVTYF